MIQFYSVARLLRKISLGIRFAIPERDRVVMTTFTGGYTHILFKLFGEGKLVRIPQLGGHFSNRGPLVEKSVRIAEFIML